VLPLISEETKNEVLKEALQDVANWRKKMIHYIKEENPEVNAAIIEAAQQSQLDPKAIALGAYLTYIMIEKAEKEESGSPVEKLLE
jgi:hypothetical protein